MSKFNGGARVRIKGGDWLRLSPYSKFLKYGNLTGEIVSSNAVIGYFIQVRTDSDEPFQVMNAYRVRLDVGIEIDDVLEESLESLNDS